MADQPSRLSDGNISYDGKNITIQEYRDRINSRNLYNLNNEYESTQLFSKNNESNIASSISSILGVIPQYNRLQVNTNLAGNVYDAFRDDGSALARIGLIMLGKHMAYNSAMNLSVKYLPSINLSNALKGKANEIIVFNQDNRITVQDKESQNFFEKVGNAASNFLGIDTYGVFTDNPFPNYPTKLEVLKNTGEGQLNHFYDAIGMNIYRPINGQNAYSDLIASNVDIPRESILVKNRRFTFDDYSSHQYSDIKFDPYAIGLANDAMYKSYTATTSSIQEYAPSIGYIKDRFGDTVSENDRTLYDYVDDISNFSSDDGSNRIVWGRDGVTEPTEGYLNNLRGEENTEESAEFNTIKPKEGLLEYTRNLLNASSGKFVDITRKAFKKDNTIVGFNGSPLWQGNLSAYALASNNLLKEGVRQHTALDPYGSDNTSLDGTTGFAKAIRFKGNIVYNAEGGNKDSVVYKSVLPRIHPTRNQDGGIDNKNLMFSIENLAVGTIKREKYGVIDDEYGTPIPLSEVGQFAGRQMWFPPYNIEINEVASAKYETTVMVGRNEPMYNYMHSERSAVLSFSLLVDYPEQLRNKNLVGKNKNKEIADFFAFGGDRIPDEYNLELIEKRIEDLKNKNDDNYPKDQSEPPELKFKIVKAYFMNDTPNETQINSVFDYMYNDNHFEIINNYEPVDGINSNGYNKDLYFITGLSATSDNKYILVNTDTSQYTSIGVADQFGESVLNKNLLKAYGDEEFRKYYDISITATASKLYRGDNPDEYNLRLSERRAEATKQLIVSKLTQMFGKAVADEISRNNIKLYSKGSEGMSSLGTDPNEIHNPLVIQERSAEISIARNNVPVDKKEPKLTEKQKENKRKTDAEIRALELQLADLKKNIKENVYNERNKAILNGFESISDNQFYPTFHSQTPEDLHRRLTFLHQCTRQGAAKRYDVIDNETGELRARNSVFGRQPICVLRLGDFLHTKVIIESVTIDYTDAPWDMNPEGFGMQPMMANITLQMKVMGGQSLKGPVDALQNAVTFNYYANSTFSDKGVYKRASQEADKQQQYIKGVIDEKQSALETAYRNKFETNNKSEGEE